MIRIYYVLTKPGIIFGNIVTTAAGFALASKGAFNVGLFFSTLLGIAFVMASACVFNNCIDRHADKKMTRTKERPLASGVISLRNALTFAIFLGIAGISILLWATNTLTALMGFAGFFFYVAMYSFWKYRSVYGTLIGSVAGAVPPVVGYCAVSNRLDAGALLLFTIIVLWQMPHFYAIALYRLDDYAAASIPVLPLKKGVYATKIHMVLYIVAYLIAVSLLQGLGYTGYAYLVIATLTGLIWLGMCIQGFKAKNNERWARHMFRFSLVVVLVLSLMVSIDTT